MQLKFLSIILLSSICGFSQNLVVNASFEDTLGCPNQINQVNRAAGWESWRGTPDYFNACANTSAPFFGLPLNNRGFQIAHTGQAYMGLFTFHSQSANSREYIGGTLSTPLIIGQQYFISFWVNHADTSSLSLTTNNLGVKFSTVTHNFFASPDIMNNQPHVFATSIINDTANWILFQGSFTADSAYTHFGIGNYFADSLTALSQIGTVVGNYAYYLIDDICISTNPQTCSDDTGLPENNLNKDFRIYPNPGNGQFFIQLLNNLQHTNVTLKISNALGQKIKEIQLSGNVTEIILEEQNGLYFLNVSGNNKTYSAMLVIQ